MIESLRIEELALVERLELAFGPGLNVLTGETGAGKSIVLGALALLAGGRAQAQAVREGADEAVVEAVFRTEGLDALGAALAERGLEAEDGTLIVRRSVARAGRSRAWVGGRLVPVSTLAELFAGRVEISSQHESQGLLRAAVQGRALDAFGGHLELRSRVEEGVRGLRAREAEIERLRTESEERARREDFLAFQVNEIDEAGLDAEEEAALEAERGRLVHAERLRTDAERASALVSGDPAASETVGGGDLLSQAARITRELSRLDPALAELAGRLEGAAAEAQDAARELERYATGIEADPARLAAVDERGAQLDRLRRKYGADVAGILAFRERAAAELAALGGSDERLRKLEAEREAERERVGALAGELSAARAAAGRALARAVSAQLADLAMADGRFEVALEPVEPLAGAPCGASGAEAAEFLFSANAGEAPQPLRRVASGGELSRVFLALKNVLRRAEAGMVLVFDEVDAGIGGAVADRVGGVLAGLSQDHQVLCITHLPQIAARGDRHFRVLKQAEGRRTRTAVEPLDADGRVDEIARMAGGETVTDATRRHARALVEGSGPAERPRSGRRRR